MANGVSEEKYFKKILDKYSLPSERVKKFSDIKKELDVLLKEWAKKCLNYTEISGSFAKGTVTTLGSDFDLFISLNTGDNLRELYNKLGKFMSNKGYSIRRQGVSIGITHNNINVDLIPAKKHTGHTYDHSIYVSRKDTWTQTNIHNHIKIIKESGRENQIKIAKIWNKLHNLDFPSFYIELTLLRSLKGKSKIEIGRGFQYYLEWLKDNFTKARIVDPSNTNNIISDLLNNKEKLKIAKKAKEDAEKDKWGTIVW